MSLEASKLEGERLAYLKAMPKRHSLTPLDNVHLYRADSDSDSSSFMLQNTDDEGRLGRFSPLPHLGALSPATSPGVIRRIIKEQINSTRVGYDSDEDDSDESTKPVKLALNRKRCGPA